MTVVETEHEEKLENKTKAENLDAVNAALAQISAKARAEWTQEAEDVTLGNMKALSNKSVFPDIVEGKEFKRNMLKPKDLIALGKIEKEIMADTNIEDEAYLKLLNKQAKICLKDWTEEDYLNCDVVMLKIVVNACVMMSKGFRRV